MRMRAIRLISYVLILTLALTVGVCAAKKIKSKSVSLNITEVTLNEGDVVAITAKMTPKKTTDKITWTSSDEEVATVKKGLVTGVAEGTAEITATTTSKKTATCIVTVKKFVTKGELVSQNMYSEEDLIALIQQYVSSGGDDWEGPVALQMVEGQKLPYTCIFNNSEDQEFTVETMTIEKEKNNDADEYGNFYLYKYTVHVEGVYAQNMPRKRVLSFHLLDNSSSTDEGGSEDMICVSEDGMHFTGDHSFYSNMNAYKFMISAMHNSSEY